MNQQLEAKLKSQLAALPAGPSVANINAAVDALVKAIDNMPDGQSPPDPTVAALWRQTGRFQIIRWTNDLRRSLLGIAEAIEDVKASPMPPAVVNEMEIALWRIDSGREKIKTVACLALGVSVVTLNAKRTNVDFEVNGKALRQKLASLSAAYPVATQLNATLNQLWNHDATNRRNEVTHELAQVADVPAVFYFQLGRVRHRQIQSWEMKSYHSNAAPFQARDLTMGAIVEQTFRAIVEALDLEIEAVNLLTQLVGSAAKLEAWEQVFYAEDAGVATLVDPRNTPPGDPWPTAKG